MTDEANFLQAMLEHPDDVSLRLVFADWLEEHGDPRAELLRLLITLTQSIEVRGRKKLECRLRELLESGVQPVGPFFINSLGMKFACIPPGTFLMGSPPNEKERNDDETQHKVTLTKGFYLGIHPVTQEQWQAVMGNNPSYFKGEKNLPVESVSWEDCQEFIKKLREHDNKPYRLPTEGEWEYACRAGTTTPFSFGGTISTKQANYNDVPVEEEREGLCQEKTTPVCGFPANGWGLYDMHGNVWEWCQDREENYLPIEVVDPQGPDVGPEERVIRGGSWLHSPARCRSAYRNGEGSVRRAFNVGFRLAFCLD